MIFYQKLAIKAIKIQNLSFGFLLNILYSNNDLSIGSFPVGLYSLHNNLVKAVKVTL